MMRVYRVPYSVVGCCVVCRAVACCALLRCRSLSFTILSWLALVRCCPVLLDGDVTACRASQSFSPADFLGCTWNSSRNFKLLGAALGDRQWCEHLLSKSAWASALIQAIGRYGDAHGSFTLLRSCAGWAKVLYSCRRVPPTLAQADADIRGALGRLVGSPLSDDDWRLAS